MSADIVEGLRAIVRGATEGSLQIDTVDRIPVDMLSHAVVEIERLRERAKDVPLDLLESLVDEDDCWFDHHGGCQTHGYLSLEQGDLCPQAELKQVIQAVRSAS